VIRALFVNENLGGHATVHLNLRRALEQRCDVEASFYDLPAPGLPRKLMAVPIPGLAGLDLDLQPLRFQLTQSAVARRSLPRLSARADVIHVYTHNVALLSTRLLRQWPTVVSLDGTNTQNAYRLPYRSPTRWTPLALKAVTPLERRVYESATLVVTHSRWAADSVATYGVDPTRIRIIPFGVTVTEGSSLRQLWTGRTTGRQGHPRIVFVGRSLERKGGHRLLRLYGEHLAGLAELDLVTLDNIEAPPGVRVINDVCPGDERLPDVLAASTVFAFPSEMDLSPNAVLEAMAAGVPVVALDVGAVSEMVEHGVTGLLVDPADDRALVEAITALLVDPALAARMGAAARERVLERFDARVTTAALVDVLVEARHLHAVKNIHSGRSATPAEWHTERNL
jgi:alpha-maltose-1-phosphate synthase